MNRERELLERSVRIIESLGPDYEAYNLIDKIEELLAQPEHIPDVGNMVTQEPVYWENEKKALLNEIDHLTNRLAQPELSTDSLQLDEQDLREDLRECLRDRFAGLAMQRLLVGYSAPAYKDAAKLSYQMADAMLIAREAGL